MSLRVAGFVALLVGGSETPNSDGLLIRFVYSGRLVSDVTVQRRCYVAVQSPEKKLGATRGVTVQ